MPRHFRPHVVLHLAPLLNDIAVLPPCVRCNSPGQGQLGHGEGEPPLDVREKGIWARPFEPENWAVPACKTRYSSRVQQPTAAAAVGPRESPVIAAAG